MTIISRISDDDGTSLVKEVLGEFVGFGKPVSWADLAKATGEREKTLRSYVGEAPPRMYAPTMMRVFAALPPGAFAKVCARMGFTSPATREVEPDASFLSALSGAAGFAAETAEALEDGSINISERRLLAKRARALIPTLEAVADDAI